MQRGGKVETDFNPSIEVANDHAEVTNLPDSEESKVRSRDVINNANLILHFDCTEKIAL